MEAPEPNESFFPSSGHETQLQDLSEHIEKNQLQVRAAMRNVADKMVMGAAVVFLGVGLMICMVNLLLLKIQELTKKETDSP